jgi:ABC-type spermidine/putrescine transport system permease subunit II
MLPSETDGQRPSDDPYAAPTDQSLSRFHEILDGKAGGVLFLSAAVGCGVFVLLEFAAIPVGWLFQTIFDSFGMQVQVTTILSTVVVPGIAVAASLWTAFRLAPVGPQRADELMNERDRF